MTDLKHYLESQSELIETHLNQLVPERHGPYQKLYESARYALLGGGKRLRPILTLTTTKALGSNPSTALTAACALEMIHSYSLIHDDLPCMDNDDYRRGKLTVHKKYSEGHAVLTGDFLLTYAFETLAKDPHLTPEKKVKLISILARQSGSEGMIGGQVMDIASEGQHISLDALRLLHRNKTGALITAAIEFGGIMADANEHHLECLKYFGDHIGLAFQIVDDILDVTSSEAKHGKKVASDVINDKTTFVSLMGIEHSQTYAKDLYQQAINALKPIPYDTSLLITLADYMINRKS
jgi:geranylgeranyl diphosphate synthase, type II